MASSSEEEKKRDELDDDDSPYEYVSDEGESDDSYEDNVPARQRGASRALPAIA